MRILIACETSGVTREACRARGLDAWSCDLEPAEDGSEHHHQGDAVEVMRAYPWAIIIAHPPCTHLASSGARWWAQKRADGRQQQGIELFMTMLNTAQWCASVGSAIENPVGIMSTLHRKPDQIVQPWWFGDRARKSTCWWLDRLPPLVPTNVVDEGDVMTVASGRSYPAWSHRLSPSRERAKIRSRTFEGMGKAMAEQWGELCAI